MTSSSWRYTFSGSWRKFHNQELSNYISFLQLLRWSTERGCCTCGGNKKCIEGFRGETWRTEIHLKDLGVDRTVSKKQYRTSGMDSCGSVPGLVNTIMDIRVLQNTGNFLTSWRNITFPRRALFHGAMYLILFTMLILCLYMVFCHQHGLYVVEY